MDDELEGVVARAARRVHDDVSLLQDRAPVIVGNISASTGTHTKKTNEERGRMDETIGLLSGPKQERKLVSWEGILRVRVHEHRWGHRASIPVPL